MPRLLALLLLCCLCLVATGAPRAGEESDAAWVALMKQGAEAVDRGRLEEAKRNFEKAVRLSGDDPTGELRRATGLNNLGYVLQKLGDLDAAERAYLQALEIRRRILGPEDASVAQSLSNLAELRRAQRRFEEARKLYEQAIRLRTRLSGPEHPDLVPALSGLALLEAEAGKGEKARQLLERCVAIRKKAFGPDHPRTLEALANLAGLEASLGELQRAESFYRKILKAQQAGDPASADLATTLVHLAEVLRRGGRSAEAVPLLRRALSIREKKLGAEHPETAWVRNDLGVNLHLLGKEEEARKLLEAALTELKRAGVPPRDRVPVLANLASVLTATGDREAAKKRLEEAISAVDEPESDTTDRPLAGRVARLWNDLAVIEYELGHYDSARASFARAIEEGEKAFGGEDPRLLPYLRNYATVLTVLERRKEAAEVRRRVKRIEQAG